MHNRNSRDDESRLVDALAQALADFRNLEADARFAAYAAWVRGGMRPRQGARAMALLREHARFGPMIELGELLLARDRSVEVLRLAAQALVETGAPSDALRLLGEAERKLAQRRAVSRAEEAAEIAGLRGRAYEQLYLDARPNPEAPRTEDFERALTGYRTLWAEAPERRLRCGINVAALLHHRATLAPRRERAALRAERDAVCREVLAHARPAAAGGDPWAAAAALEACVPVPGRRAELLAHLETYTRLASPFALRSTLRQLRTLWRLTPDKGAGRVVLPALEERLARAAGTTVDLSPRTLERVFGSESYRSLDWYLRGLAKTRAVGRVSDNPDRGVGTCFLVSPRHVLTCWHVVPQGLDPEECLVRFETPDEAGQPTQRLVRRLVWPPRDEGLDVALLELDAPVAGGRAPLPLAPVRARRFDAGCRAYVVGYPEGRGLAISLHDSHILESNDWFFQYRTPTTQGSSGSPVFDADWNLIGMHRAGHGRRARLTGSDRHEANEAVRLDAILAALGDEAATLGVTGPTLDVPSVGAPMGAPTPIHERPTRGAGAVRVSVVEAHDDSPFLDEVAARLGGEVVRARSVAEAVAGVERALGDSGRLAALDLVGHARPGMLSMGLGLRAELDPRRALSAAWDALRPLERLRDRLEPGAPVRLLGCNIAAEKAGRLLLLSLSACLDRPVSGALHPVYAHQVGAAGYIGEPWRLVTVDAAHGALGDVVAVGPEGEMPAWRQTLRPVAAEPLPEVVAAVLRRPDEAPRALPDEVARLLPARLEEAAHDARGLLVSAEATLEVRTARGETLAWSLVFGGRALLMPGPAPALRYWRGDGSSALAGSSSPSDSGYLP